MKVICLANQKGGVGKTTTTINLAVELSKKNRVLVIDLDPQGNCSKIFTNGEREFVFEQTSAYLFDKPKNAEIRSLISPSKGGEEDIKNCDVIVSDYQLSRVIETSLTKINRERILEKHLAKIKDQYDYVLLDTPPNLSLTTLNAIQACDLILITVDSGAFSLDGITPLLEAAEEIKGEEVPYRVVRNEVDKRNSVINEFINEELDNLNGNIIPVVIRRSEDVTKANALSLPVRYFSKNSLVLNDYKRVAESLKTVIESEEVLA